MDHIYYQWLGNRHIHDFVWIGAVALSVVIYTMITRIHGKLERRGGNLDSFELFETVFGGVLIVFCVTIAAIFVVMTLPYFLAVLASLLLIHICVSGLVKKKKPWTTFTDLFLIFAEKKK